MESPSPLLGVLGAGAGVLLREGLKDMLLEFLAHTNAGIAHGVLHGHGFAVAIQLIGPQRDVAARAVVLDRVAEQVDQNLPQLQRVAPHAVVLHRDMVDGHGQTVALGLRLGHNDTVMDQLVQVGRGLHQLGLPVFQPVHIQHVIDEGEQMVGGAAYLVGAVIQAGVVLVVLLGNVQHTQNCVDGGCGYRGSCGRGTRSWRPWRGWRPPRRAAAAH